MRSLVDAQLPRRVCAWLRDTGHDATHTLDLPNGNRTTDSQLLDIADFENRVRVTKGVDFVQSFFVLGRPRRLLLIATGNISNGALAMTLKTNLPQITVALETGSFVEIGADTLIVHQ